jgi:tRNA(fMet)-specific endonuclease VapC
MRTYLLDTNTISNIVRRKSPAARAALLSLPPTGIACISAITEAEILYGLAKTPQAHALRAAMQAVLAKIHILPWGRPEAEAYGTLRAGMEAAGRSLENLDMLIAAHALAIGATLVTSDKAFRHVSDLHNIVDWATDL